MSKKRNFHKEAIDVLAWQEMRPVEMLRHLAKEAPAALVAAAYALGYKPPVNLNVRILELMQAGQKIDAIRLARNETNMGLAEAKEYVEKLAA